MKILLISYHFPPYNSVGAVRPGKLAKYLRQQGHEVHVLTADAPVFPKGQQLEIPASFVHAVKGWSVNAPIHWLLGGRKKVAQEGYLSAGKTRSWLQWLGKLYKTLLHWPDAEMGWVARAIQKGSALLSAQEFDLIYVSAPSFSALRVGHHLSRISDVPWVVEFRDLWSDNHHYAYPAWRRYIERIWEECLLSSASVLVTVSAPLAHTLRRFQKPVWEIRNGFDPQDLIGLTPYPTDSDVLHIVYTGSVYPEHDLETFCAGLSAFRKQGGRAEVHVAGRNVAPLQEAALQQNVEDMLVVKATVAREEALRMQCSADILLLFLWGSAEGGIYTTKLFEYAGMQRPIIAIGSGRCDVSRWIGEAGLGVIAGDTNAVTAYLHECQRQKKSGGVPKVIPKSGDDFSRETPFAMLNANLVALVDERV